MGCCESASSKQPLNSEDVHLDEGVEEEADVPDHVPEIIDVESSIPHSDGRPSPSALTPNGELHGSTATTLDDLARRGRISSQPPLESSGPSRLSGHLVVQKHWARKSITGGVPEDEEASPTTPQSPTFEREGGKKPTLKRALTKIAAGHGGLSIIKDFADDNNHDGSGIPDYINKVFDEIEATVYTQMQETGDPLRKFTPTYHGMVEVIDEERGTPESYMRLSNLLKSFKPKPHVMDCKLGVRSFTEEEVNNPKLREDLYKRMVKLDADAPTPEEHEAQAITKYRWMTFNDKITSLSSHGFRVDGIASTGSEVSKQELKKLKEFRDVAHCIIKYFLPVPVTEDGKPVDDSKRIQLQKNVALQILLRLKDMRETMQASPFVQCHSIVGSSLLFVADQHGPDAGVFLIDFAKTFPVPEGTKIDHRSQWVPGNNEDGIFLGISNMISCWEKVLELLSINLKLC